MPQTYTTRAGETLCTIGVQNGFKNCTKLRAANPGIATPLPPSVQITIPDPTDKQVPGATKARHEFRRLGVPSATVWIIQDHNNAPFVAIARDVQRKLAISNYVTGRQGTGFATTVWKDENFFGFDAGASADPDHFKLLVRDDDAAKKGLAEVSVDLESQTPVLDASARIASWITHSGPGTILPAVTCRAVASGSPFFQSHYLRLVVDPSEQANRKADGTDPADDRSDQTLVVPALPLNTINAIEILDSRVTAERLSPKCATPAPDTCRAFTSAEVGKDEMALRVKVYRVGDAGAGVSIITPATIQKMLFTSYRQTLAQANVGIVLVDNRVHDVALPFNMITVSDFVGVKTKGDGQITVIVFNGTSNVTITMATEKKKKPAEIAAALSSSLGSRGFTCRLSPNPPTTNSSNDFGSCDLLVFKADGNPARIMRASSTDSHCKLAHTGLWNNNNVRDGVAEYGNREPEARYTCGMDYRAVAKNYNFNNSSHLSVLLVNRFAPMANGNILLGYGLVPYGQLTARIRPVQELTFAVLLDNNGAGRRTVLPHEAGHVLLDAIHTTSGSPEVDWAGNRIANNAVLGFSEWMAAMSQEGNPPFLHLRMSDTPLTVQFQVVSGNSNASIITMGSGSPNPVARFRTLGSSRLAALRQLPLAPR